MRILRRYITGHLLWTTFLALFVMIALFSFFTLIDELGKTGQGSYGITQVLFYVFLTMPRLAYDLFPIAAVIGAMAVLGIMAQNSELDVIRAAGVSRLRLAMLLVQSGLLLVLIAVLLGEFIAPPAEETAQNMRSMAMTRQITLQTRHGLWVRNGNSFINIRKILPGRHLQDIYVYDFGDNDRLQSSVHAGSADYKGGQWILHDIRQSVIEGEHVSSTIKKKAAWGSLLDPDVFNVVNVKPDVLPVWELFDYVSYLRQNDQNSQLYEQALWSKLVRPFAILAMIVLAVPLVRGNSRFTSIGQRVFTGALAGIVFHLCNEVSSHLGVVYGISPAFSAAAPTLLLMLLLLFLLRE